jgi:hypothetical protein
MGATGGRKIMAIKESTHWYDTEGKPAYTIIGANGNERATTLRDARKHNYFPSVTTIMGAAAKPALENWKIDQALMAALTLPKEEEESLDDFMKRAKKDAKESAIQAAARGTEIHADIESGFSGTPSKAYHAVRIVLDQMFPGEEWVAEDSFSSPSGYGGKIDLYSKSGIFVDFKTKDGLQGKEPKKLVYDEHGMQLSAYSKGMDVALPQRASIFIDRADPGIVLAYKWDEESHQRHLGMFLSLLKFWQFSKNYTPSAGGE